MLLPGDFHKFRPVILSLVLALLLAFVAIPAGATTAKPPAAPPVVADSTLPNLWYGAVPPGGSTAPVLVFVHGLAGSYADWLESSNCPPGPTVCGPNGVGAGTGNDMYDYAYENGFRTVFMSMSQNNTNNSATIQANAAMLQTMFPRIQATYSVSKVYFVCHSKGGLDLEAAIANPQWIGIANAVITLATPNQGDALADWLFSPSGQSVGQTLGLLNPGVQSLEISNVEQLRTQWDPIFQNAQIPFYTVAGDTWCPNTGCTGGSTTITGPILQGITGGSKVAPPNDGLVTEPETALPTTYAMNLGVEHVDHYQLRLGDNSFSMIYSRVMAQEFQQPGFTRVGTNGFGDQHNSESWSMVWFNGKLYVGTGREVSCVSAATAAIQLGLPQLYPPVLGDCTPDYHLLPLQAEIWQYTPQTNTWVRVFQSPNSLTTTSNTGQTVATAREMGIRSLTVVTEPGGTVALYAGTVTSGAIFEPNHTVGGWPPPRILRSVDGVTWNQLPQAPGTFLGNLSQLGTQQFQNFGIRSGQQLNGILYLQVGDYSGVGRVIASLPGANPSGGNNNFQFVSPPAETLPVWILEPFNNFMYAGCGNPYNAGTTLYSVYKTNGQGPAPYTWTPVVIQGGYAQGLISNYAMSTQVFADTQGCPGVGCLYIGTDEPNELIRIHPDTTGNVPDPVDSVDSWDLVVGNPRTIPAGEPGAGQLVAPISGIGQYFDNGFTGHFWRMGVGSLGLYMSTWDWSADNSYLDGYAASWSQEFGTDVVRSNDGVHWTSVTRIGMGDGWNTGGRTFASTPVGLYWGTARPVGGTQVFMLDNGTLDFNHDGVIDQNDVNLMTTRLNTVAKAKDPMDLNQDGKITTADVQILKTQCTYPGCAAPKVRPAASTLGIPVVDSSAGPLGSTVSLSWSPVSGAVDYLVYRITFYPLNAPPPPPSGSPLAAACSTNPAAGGLKVCYAQRAIQRAAQPGATTAYGYPGPVTFLTRVSSPAYSETPPSSLQAMYYVRAEDANGNLSVPSNVVGGPSLAAQ